MDTSIVQHHSDLSGRVFGEKRYQEVLECLCIIRFTFLVKHFSRCIVQCPKEFGALMLAIRFDLALVPSRKPVILQGLVGADHGFIFKEQVIDLSVHELFFKSIAVFSRNSFCSSGSAAAKVYVAFV
ncbi:hypothetical protein D3C80_1711050 [compost metagenome]